MTSSAQCCLRDVWSTPHAKRNTAKSFFVSAWKVGVLWLFISLCASSLLGLSMPFHNTANIFDGNILKVNAIYLINFS